MIIRITTYEKNEIAFERREVLNTCKTHFSATDIDFKVMLKNSFTRWEVFGRVLI